MIKDPINEFQLLEYARCPMRVATEQPYAKTDLEQDAHSVLAGLLVASFTGEKVSLKQVREKLDKINKKRSVKYPELRLVRLSSRLHELFTRYRVLQPITPYRLCMDQFCLAGEYAVLQRTNVKNEIAALRVRGFGDDQYAGRNVPDLVNYARWFHMRMNELEYRNHVVLNFNVLNNVLWLDTYDEQLVRKSLGACGKAWTEKLIYQSPGEHCSTCLTKVCGAS
jgi:hypothetical protein